MLGVSEKSVRKAVKAGHIPQRPDGKFDVERCRQAWRQTTDPARSKLRTSADQARDVRRGPHQVRTARSAVLSEAGAPDLWAVLAYLVDLIPWAVTEHGGGLQLAFRTWSDAMLDLPAELRRRGLAGPAIDFGVVDWLALAEAHGLTPIDPAVMAADYARPGAAHD